MVISSKRKDIRNLLSLMLIQGSNGILPIFVFPYVLIKIGVDFYSSIAVSQAVALIIVTIVLYSFDVNGVSKVIQHLSNKDDLSTVCSNIFYARSTILLACILVILIISPFLKSQFFILTLCWMMVPLSYIFQSTYLFLGLQNTLPLAVFVLISRAVLVGLIICFIHTAHDFFKVPLIVGGCYLISSVGAYFYAMAKFKIRFKKPSLRDILDYLYDGKEIFLGSVSVILYRDCNIIILSLLTHNAVAISAYSIANKLINALQATARPLNQLFFPKILIKLQKFTRPNKQAFKLVAKMTYPQIIILAFFIVSLAVVFILVSAFSNLLVHIPSKQLIALSCVIMFVAVFIGVANFMFGTAGLNQLGMKKYYAISMLKTGIITIVSGCILVLLFGGIGAAMNFVVGEALLFLFVVNKYLRS
tara:strand:- start:212627 stop:213880 length:1254 start_codon:yes stop_codon:yes gene_type:complete